VLKTVDAHGQDERAELDRPRNAVIVLSAAALAAVFLSVISIAGAATLRVASILRPRLAGEVTIVVWGHGLESADAAAARAAELLAGQAGVRRATVLEANDSDATVGELVAGRSPSGEGARLVSVSGAPDLIPSTSSLRHALNINRLAASIDDHRGTAGLLESRALVAGGLGIVLDLALSIGLFAVCWMDGHNAARVGSARFDLMVRLGAEPAYFGGMVGRRSGMVALAGAVAGTVFANLILFATVFVHGFWRGLGVAVVAQPQPRDGLWTIASPFVVMAIAAVGGGLGARRGIARRERRI
jgi:hypothetical protein